MIKYIVAFFVVSIIISCNNTSNKTPKNGNHWITFFIENRSDFSKIVEIVEDNYVHNEVYMSYANLYFINCDVEKKFTFAHICDNDIVAMMEKLSVSRIELSKVCNDGQCKLYELRFTIKKTPTEYSSYYLYHSSPDSTEYIKDTYLSLPIDSHWSYENDRNFP